MARVKAGTKAKLKKKGPPVKAGSTMSKNIGGIANAKLVAIIKKEKNG